MQTTRCQPSRVIAALCLIFTIVLLYVALQLRSNQTSDEDEGQHISYGLKNKNRILERARQVRLEGYDSDGSDTPTDQDDDHEDSNPTDPPISTVTDPLDTSRNWHPVDARSVSCRKRSASASANSHPNISLIVDFRLPPTADGMNQVIDQLQSTVGSLIGGSQLVIGELIVVSYSPPTAGASGLSTDPRLLSYIASLKLPPSKLIVKAGKTQANARMSAFAESKGAIIVFADHEVVGTVGWLRPLVTSLIEAKDEKTIVQPHLDDASRFPDDYTKTAERMVPDYSWPLTIALYENSELISPSPQIKGRFMSPVVRGNVFAVQRAFFDSIGGYEEKLMAIVSDDSSVATHLELSFRTWMCHGTIQTAPCSRVGIRNLADRRRMSVAHRPSAERIADLWFGNRKEILLTGLPAQMQHPGTKQPRSKRSPATTGNRKCENIDWYFNNVSSASRVPTGDAVQFGQLRSQTGLCAHVGDDNHVDVIDCKLAAKFEQTASGQLTAGDDGCLAVQSNSFVLIEACHHHNDEKKKDGKVDGNSARLRQEWIYNSDRQQLVNPWSKFCAMHVTDPRNGTVSWRQIVMAQNCSTEALSRTAAFNGRGAERFTHWSFVNV